MQHTQAVFWCSLREEQATSLKNTEGNPAHDPSQKEMERSLTKPQSVKPLAATLGFPRKQRPQSNYLLCSDIIRKKMVSSVLERCEVFSIPFLHTKFLPCFVFFMALITFNPIVITPSEGDLVVILTGLENYTQWL